MRRAAAILLVWLVTDAGAVGLARAADAAQGNRVFARYRAVGRGQGMFESRGKFWELARRAPLSAVRKRYVTIADLPKDGPKAPWGLGRELDNLH